MDLLFRAKRAYEHSQQNKKIEKSDFRSNHAFEKRVNESKRIIEKYPDRVPIICERITKNVPQVDRKKYLCPGDLSLANFMYVIRKRMNLSPEKSIYMFVGNESLAPVSHTMGMIYDHHKDNDQFLICHMNRSPPIRIFIKLRTPIGRKWLRF